MSILWLLGTRVVAVSCREPFTTTAIHSPPPVHRDGAHSKHLSSISRYKISLTLRSSIVNANRAKDVRDAFSVIQHPNSTTHAPVQLKGKGKRKRKRESSNARDARNINLNLNLNLNLNSLNFLSFYILFFFLFFFCPFFTFLFCTSSFPFRDPLQTIFSFLFFHPPCRVFHSPPLIRQWSENHCCQ